MKLFCCKKKKVKDHIRLKNLWVGQIFHSSFNSRSRGAAIIIHKKNTLATNIISDLHGRIIVSGSLYHKPVLLVNIYAPDWDDEKFIEKVISSIPDLNSRSLIFGGDPNCTINPSFDCSSPKIKIPPKMAKTLSSFMNQIGCFDPWRFCFPHSKVFSFFYMFTICIAESIFFFYRLWSDSIICF